MAHHPVRHKSVAYRKITETLRIVYYPFVYGVALGCATLSLIFLISLLQSIFPEKEEAS